MTIEQKYLDEFSYFGKRIYMNVSSIGLQPERTRRFSRIFLDEYADSFGNPSFGGGSDSRMRAKEAAAKMLHCSPEDVFLTENTTEGNNLIPYGYPFAAGDEVIVGNGDFVTVWLPWAGLAERGIKVVVVPNENGVTDVDDYIARITEKTRAIAISWVQSSSGYRADIAKLGEACRARGILLCVDGIQGMGRVPIDVEAMKIDVFASGSFKGLMGVMGAGFCYCRKEVMAKVDPHLCSGNLADFDFPWSGFNTAPVPKLAQRAARMESGTCNHYGYSMMRTSMELLTEIGIEKIAAVIRETEAYLRKNLKEAFPGVIFLGTEDPDTWSGTLALCMESISGMNTGLSEKALAEALEKRNIYVTVRGGTIRIALHYYNNIEQAQLLVKALKEIVGGTR